MYIVAIAWMFVVVLMAAAEAMSTSVFGGLMTLLFYGILPLALMLYLLGTPARRKSRAEQRSPLAPAAPPEAGRAATQPPPSNDDAPKYGA